MPGPEKEPTRVASISDVAQLAAVSNATVSRALSGGGAVSQQTRAAVLRAADALGYRPSFAAYALATGRTGSVAVVVPTLDRRFLLRMARAAGVELSTFGLAPTIIETAPDGPGRPRLSELLRARGRFEGVLLLGMAGTETGMAGDLPTGPPIVRVGQEESTSDEDADSLAAMRAVSHLHSLGHTRIAFVGVDDSVAASTGFDRRRRAAFAGAIDRLHLHGTIVEGGSDETSGFGAAVELLDSPSPRPTAIVASTSEIAAGVATGAHRLGFAVPETVSIISLEDDPSCRNLDLTSVDTHPEIRGQGAARQLMKPGGEGLSDGGSERKPALVLRHSTAFTSGRESG
ncbi:LacI family DNA-binding transcriptional regulator [Agromyces sp. M3QZ16-3]|uniref:LacI family DNA-binding transcriptional regulator n=1 Tax=Agromyces sp. M3QZ16-3 TaxID=3447585 RepID=UPI003F68C770